RRPIARGHQYRDLGLLVGKAGAEPDMRAELVRVLGEAGAFQPDMHRRRHRTTRPGLGFGPDLALGGVEFTFVEQFVARHGFRSYSWAIFMGDRDRRNIIATDRSNSRRDLLSRATRTARHSAGRSPIPR